MADFTHFKVMDTIDDARAYVAWDSQRRKGNRWRGIIYNRRRSLSKNAIDTTPEQLCEVFIQQRCRCSSCGVHDREMTLHADHCHDTGKFRSFLCEWCNRDLDANRGLTQSKLEKRREVEGRTFPISFRTGHYSQLESDDKGRKRLIETKTLSAAKILRSYKGRRYTVKIRQVGDETKIIN